MELQRNPPPNTDPNLRIFTIRGIPQQIEVARHLIDEKVGVRTRPFPPELTNSWIFWWMSKVPVFPRTSYFLNLFILASREGPSSHFAEGEGRGPGIPGSGPGDEGSLWQNSPRPPAQAPEPCPLQA